MKTLITPLQVLKTAFGDGEILPPASRRPNNAGSYRSSAANSTTGCWRASTPTLSPTAWQPRRRFTPVRWCRRAWTSAPTAWAPRPRNRPTARQPATKPADSCAANCWKRPARCCNAQRTIWRRTKSAIRNTSPMKTGRPAARSRAASSCRTTAADLPAPAPRRRPRRSKAAVF